MTVGDVLADKHKYHGTRFADPLEPDYGNDLRIAWANLFAGGRPYLYSHAHGGRRFDLYPQSRVLLLERGELVRTADKVLEVLRLASDVYDYPTGSGTHRVVYTRDGCVLPATDAFLRSLLGRYFRCERYDKRSKKREPADVPKELVEEIQARTADRNLPRLEGIVTAPVMRADGTLLDTPGYSAIDRLLYECDDLDAPRIASDPTEEEIKTAFAELWKPVSDFPFVNDEACGAMLAALLTAVIRPCLSDAPGFAIDAPQRGTGKTKLAKCLARLAGVTPHPDAPPPDDAEAKKVLFAALRSGARVIVWDNPR